VGPDAVVVLKYHGSYQQDNREKRERGKEKKYSFMLRLKQPFGEMPPHLYKELDDMANEYGQDDLRATTRQAFQLHGILKGDLKTVINRIMACGSSTVGACGDVSRNVMSPSAPFASPDYKMARLYSVVLAELFKPQSPTFSQLWETPEIPGDSLSDIEDKGQKVADIEFWQKDLVEAGLDIAGTLTDDRYGGLFVLPRFAAAFIPPAYHYLTYLPSPCSRGGEG
jgi:sulfite reductase (ferredoxin)